MPTPRFEMRIMRKTKAIKAQCPVCHRIVTVTATGALRTHGNKEFAGFAQCSKIAYRGIDEGWKPNDDGVLCAPPEIAQRLWDPRVAVEAWAPLGIPSGKIYELVTLLQRASSDATRELISVRQQLKDEREQREYQDRIDASTRHLTPEVAHQVMAPAVEAAMARYETAESVADAAVGALMRWLEADHGQG